MRGKISKTTVERLKAGEIMRDDKVDGFVARRLPSGKITYGYRYRAKGIQKWFVIGVHGANGLTSDLARKVAENKQAEVNDKRDPVAERQADRAEAKKVKLAETNTVDAILDAFIARYVVKLRSADAIKRALEMHVRPRIGSKSIYEVSRRDVTEMLDEIEDGSGPVMADRVLAYVRKAFNWHAARDDRFSPPIVRGMARTKPSERARDRVLSDDEIRVLFAALKSEEMPESFRRFVPTLLLTAQRRNNVLKMRHEAITGGVWEIEAADYKNKTGQAVPLSAKAMEYIGSGKGFVFPGRLAGKPFNGLSKSKAELDRAMQKLAKGKLKNWTFHDLRRTARTLMSRAGVDADIAERVLGHVIGGVRGVYDRHAYLDEKRLALEKLGLVVAGILEPKANVIPMVGTRHG